ncbi:MAG: hypothetical protein WCC25_10700 [Candidatus Korobacteraceae bacterium]
MPQTISSFDHTLARDEEKRALIKSTCKNCGASKVVSIRDGSMAEWEYAHICKNVRQ